MSRFASSSRNPRRLFVFGIAVLAISVVRPSWGELKEPDPKERYVTRAVTFLLGREHLSKRELNDEVSQRSFDSFMKTLDPMKLYFNQSDVDEFSAKRNQLDDLAREGDITFAFDVFNRFLKRVDERVAMIDQLLAGEFDYSLKEEMITDGKAAKYLGTPAGPTVGGCTRRTTTSCWRCTSRRLTTSFDPHTTYMSPRTLENFEIKMRLELDGIGGGPVRGRLHDGHQDHSRRGGRQGRPPQARGQDRRRGPRDRRRNGRRRRHEALRRGRHDPRQTGHAGPAQSQIGRLSGTQGLRYHPS